MKTFKQEAEENKKVWRRHHLLCVIQGSLYAAPGQERYPARQRLTTCATVCNQYLNRNGLYSNGYFGSPDHFEDLDPSWQEMCNKMFKDLFDEKS